MTKLVLVRHGQSVWNKENRFTGFNDVDLSEQGKEEAKNASELLLSNNIKIDIAFTSKLKRAINTCKIIVDNQVENNKLLELVSKSLNVNEDSALNERDYGDLTGKNKDEIKAEHGEEQLHKWRRSFSERPPNGENLSDVCSRVSNYYNQNIKQHLQDKNVLIAAHGNSLRALLVVLEIYNSAEIEHIEIPTSKPFIIDFKDGEIINHRYLNKISFKGRQILDSRGNPTVEVDLLLNNVLISRDSCPSGASTGSNEARELRDKDDKYLGKGVENAAKNVNKFSSSSCIDISDVTDQIKFDKMLCKFDGTTLKENIGGNTTTAISFAAATGSAQLMKNELFEHLRTVYGGLLKLDCSNNAKFNTPTPMVNILNGGKHAGGNLQIQEFMIMPRNDISFKEKLHNVTLVYHNLGKLLVEKYGVSSKNLGDEGGYAPSLHTPEEALEVIEEAIIKSNLLVNKDIFLALDCASSEYYYKEKDIEPFHNCYEIEKGMFLNSKELSEYYLKLIQKHPALISLEDPFDEHDYEGWKIFTESVSKLDRKIMIVGDDLFTTNIDTVKKGLENKWANSLLLKVNQIGTITEAVEAAKLMFDSNFDVIVSHRSGETTSTLIADLAVAINAGYIKTGAPARGERIAKYNRLLQIEEVI